MKGFVNFQEEHRLPMIDRGSGRHQVLALLKIQSALAELPKELFSGQIGGGLMVRA